MTPEELREIANGLELWARRLGGPGYDVRRDMLLYVAEGLRTEANGGSPTRERQFSCSHEETENDT